MIGNMCVCTRTFGVQLTTYTLYETIRNLMIIITCNICVPETDRWEKNVYSRCSKETWWFNKKKKIENELYAFSHSCAVVVRRCFV